jgi:hypothetical protein
VTLPPGERSVAQGERDRRRQRLVTLGATALGAAVIAAGCILEIGEDGLRLGATELPPTCPWRTVLGGGCPGCGLARSVVAFCHFGWQDSWRFHPGGPLVVLAAAIQVANGSAYLLRLRCSPILGRFLRGSLALALVAALVRWAAGFLYYQG